MKRTLTSEETGSLDARGYVIDGPFAQPEEAWIAAEQLVDAAAGDEGPLTVIGDFLRSPGWSHWVRCWPALRGRGTPS
jgi:hypothetical protein